MKKLLLNLIVVICFSYALGYSADWSKPKGDGYKFEISECGKDCMEVRTKNNTLRIYSCGKVEKLNWKEINPNEDTENFSAITGSGVIGYDLLNTTSSTGTTLVIESEEYAKRYCSDGYHKIDDYWVCD